MDVGDVRPDCAASAAGPLDSEAGPGVAAALEVIERLGSAGLDVRLRKRPTSGGSEIDLWLARRDRVAVERGLATAGFRRFVARGQGTHRFYLGHLAGRWIKLDAKLTPSGPPTPRWWQVAARRLPASRHRAGPVVAFVGPDGAGKGTVIDGVRAHVPVALDVVYLGSHGSRRDRARAGTQPPAAPLSAGDEPRWRRWLEPVFVCKGLALHARRLFTVYVAAWRGRVVVCDRHPIEALATDPRRTRLARAIERAVVLRLLPWPDRVVVLDAPAETMYARKGEHSVERLERWRAGYRSELVARGALPVTTDGDVGTSVRRASTIVWDALCERRGWSGAQADGGR